MVLAGPVCSPSSAAELGDEVDHLVCLEVGEQTARVTDVERLAGRLAEVTGWVGRRDEFDGPPVGYVGASTGAPAAMWAAAAAWLIPAYSAPVQ